MKKITSYVKAKTEKCLAIHDEYQDDFHYIAFGHFPFVKCREAL